MPSSEILIRTATRADIPGMHRIRLAVRENRLTSNAVTERDYPEALEKTGQGWVALRDQQLCGFAIGNRETGNIWALFVDPDAEGLGVGKRLHAEMVAWLFAQGLTRLNLGTDPGTRAEKFYVKAGWQFVKILADGEACYALYPEQHA